MSEGDKMQLQEMREALKDAELARSDQAAYACLLRSLEAALDLSLEGETHGTARSDVLGVIELHKAQRDNALKDAERLRAEVARLEKVASELSERVAHVTAAIVKDGGWIAKAQADVCYNQGCADTVAAFRKAQGDA